MNDPTPSPASPPAVDWRHAYARGATPWDLRRPTPPLHRLLADGRLAAAGLRPGAVVAVPGCGRGHDLRPWAAAGFDTVGFDVVPEVVEEARALLRLNRSAGRVLCRDVFGLLPEFAAAFDLVYDYTCYCALPPHLRAAYAAVLAGLLRDGGLLLHLTFPDLASHVGHRGEPPFVITAGDLHASFGARFGLLWRAEVQDSMPERAGAEHWWLWRRTK